MADGPGTYLDEGWWGHLAERGIAGKRGSPATSKILIVIRIAKFFFPCYPTYATLVPPANGRESATYARARPDGRDALTGSGIADKRSFPATSKMLVAIRIAKFFLQCYSTYETTVPRPRVELCCHPAGKGQFRHLASRKFQNLFPDWIFFSLVFA